MRNAYSTKHIFETTAVSFFWKGFLFWQKKIAIYCLNFCFLCDNSNNIMHHTLNVSFVLHV